jgi:hypothetical protein
MKRVLVFLMLLLNLELASAQWPARRDPASLNRMPQSLNEGAVVKCLPKLQGVLTAKETASLDALKVQIERIYSLSKPMIHVRELIYRTSNNEKWRVQFFLVTDSLYGKERYRLSYFKANERGAFAEIMPPGGIKMLDKQALLVFAQDQEIESDERWERFAVPGDPAVSIKMKDFKIYELLVKQRGGKSTLLCSLGSNHPFCHCSQ